MIKTKIKHAIYVGLGLTALFPASAFALTFQQSITLPTSLEYETNPRLTTNDVQSVKRTILKPNYSLIGTQNNDQFSINIGLNVERSSNQSASADREDPNIGLDWTHTYEKGQFGLTANFQEQSTRTSEFNDTGLVTNNNTRQTRSIGSNWNRTLSEQYSLSVNANVTKVEFGSVSGSFNDYENTNINTQLSYSINEQIESYVQVSLSRFEPVSTSKTDFRSVDLGVTWAVNDSFIIDGNIGVNKTSGSSSESGWQAKLNADYSSQRNKYNVTLSRSRAPSGLGIINESNQLGARWSYSLSEKENLGLNVNYRENLTSNKNETTNITVNYTRALSREWDFRLAAQRRNRNDSTSDVSSNSYTATIIYKLPDF